MYKKLFAAVMVGLTLLLCYPVVFIVTGALTGETELQADLAAILTGGDGYMKWSLLPSTPTLRSVVEILLDTPRFFVMFWNSVKIAAGVLVGQLLVAVPAAWGMAKYRFPMRRAFFFLYVALMLLPFQVMMLSDYFVLSKMGLTDTLWSLILPGTFSTFPVFIMYHSFQTVPEAVLEAARIDGAGEWKIFIRIGIPAGMPGIISAGVLCFLEYWNLIEQPMTFIKDQTLMPMSLFLPQITEENAGSSFAASVAALIPPLLVFFAGGEYLEKGISSLGLKE